MEDIKQTVAKNITQLRRAVGMTQLELAERLNYSDKAVSKWERGESLPDVAVLKQIADLFRVSVDYLLTPEHAPAEQRPLYEGPELRNRQIIMAISILLVWLVATLVFVILNLLNTPAGAHWLSFAYAVPASMVVWLVFSTVWFNPRRNFVIVSILMWSMLLCIHLTLLLVGFNVWLIYILGLPGQAIILLWSRLKFKK